jgi:acyl-CoA hydrolase
VDGKTVDSSKVTMAVVMMPEHANWHGNVHGGEIMKLMDNVAGVVATRHARSNVITAWGDEL